MKKITLYRLSLLLLFVGCSSTHEVVNVSNTHAYNSNYGLIQNYEVDARIQQEIWSQNRPTEVETYNSNPNWTTELVLDPDAVTAENYVQAPTVITYKYKFDPKFYDKAIWKSNE
jgi:uncharacterized protein YcfL